MISRLLLLLVVLFSLPAVMVAHAVENHWGGQFEGEGQVGVCRYCAENSQRLLPLGLDLEGRYQYAPERQVDVKHIKIDVTPDFQKRTVSGTVSITAVPISKALEVLRLDAVELSVKAVRADGAEVDDFFASRRDLKISLKKPVSPGNQFVVHIDYEAQPDAGLYFRTPEMGYPEQDIHLWTQGEAHEARHWFPCFDYPNERSSTEVICRVPSEMVVLSNGRKLSERVDSNGLKSVRWLQEKPHVNYLICLVAGNLKKLEKQHRDIPLGFYTQPTLFEHAANSFRDTDQIMAFYEQEIGVPYPWDKYDQVTIRDFTAGGMENTTLTTLTHTTIFSEATENLRSTRSLDAHELAHQWFGDYVTCKDWSHLWLNEGFATYYTHLYEGHKFGRDALLYGLYTDATNRILTQKNDTKPIVFNGYKNPMQQFDYRSYPKGSWVLHMLRSQLGEQLYRKCIREYLEQHALTSVVSDDLRQVIERNSGRPFDRFFDQWLYHARHPDLKISYTWLPKENLARLNVRQTQKVSDDVVLFHLPATFRFTGDFGVKDVSVDLTKESEDFYVALDGKPSTVRFDPEYTILADVSFDKPMDLLKAQLGNQEDMMGRLLACVALGKKKTHESVELLSTRLKEDSFFGVRMAAADALAKHESDEARSALHSRWKDETDAKVRRKIVQAMLKEYRPESLTWASEVLDNEKNPGIQVAAILALGKFQSPESQQRLLSLLGVKSFGNAVTVAVINSMGQLNDPQWTLPILTTLKERQDEFSANDFARGLGVLARTASLGEEKKDTLEFLLSLTNHPMARVRVAAVSSLGDLGEAQAISVVESFSSSEETRMADSAKRALTKLREKKPVTPAEVIKLRESIDELRQQTEKLQKELKAISDKAEAKNDG